MQLTWERPDDAPEGWLEFQTWTDTHVLKIWKDYNADWCGLITEMVSWDRVRLEINAENKEQAMLQVEQHYFKREGKQ